MTSKRNLLNKYFDNLLMFNHYESKLQDLAETLNIDIKTIKSNYRQYGEDVSNIVTNILQKQIVNIQEAIDIRHTIENSKSIFKTIGNNVLQFSKKK